jgi:hypothetical protein
MNKTHKHKASILKVSVTREDIINGDNTVPHKDPCAIAMTRAWKEQRNQYVIVECNGSGKHKWVDVWTPDYGFINMVHKLPESMHKFIDRFDNSEKVYPFEFEIKI